MNWTTPQEVRKVIGLGADDVSDEDLDYYIGKAQKELLDQLCVFEYEDKLVGNIDGVNITFNTHYAPIADRNFDLVVNTLDVEVYKWGHYGLMDTKSTVPISTVYPDKGIIVLGSAPGNTIEVVTATYYSFPRQLILDRLPTVTALLAGYHYIRSEVLLLPQQWFHGSYRFIRGTPAEDILLEYYRNLDILLGREHRKVTPDAPTFLRDV
uniref:Uncharacterized protein n=1 Tax=viral metagenome TaxID=1070528 RepID=A0A6H1ZKH4_9ZZZZ